jgi:carbon storage regulator
MLILTRRVGETVMVGNDVTVTIVGVKGSQIRIGIYAKKSTNAFDASSIQRVQRSVSISFIDGCVPITQACNQRVRGTL